MDIQQVKQRLLELYPVFQEMPPELLGYTFDNAVVRTVPAGTVMFDERNPCQAFPMILDGSIRVSKMAPNGRELQLYRVGPGRAASCRRAACSAPRPTPHAVWPIRDDGLRAPAPVFNHLISQHQPFRAYVFGLFAERIVDLMQLVEAVAFHSWTSASRRCSWARAR
jgi:CRP/FNR family transcriptional regulator